MRFKYLAAYTVPILVFLSLYWKGAFSYLALVTLFGLVPLVELLFSSNKENLPEAEEKTAEKDPIYDWMLYGMIPCQFGLLIYFLSSISDQSLERFEQVGMTIAMGISCGVLGINVAHELGHRSTKFEQNLSKMLLLTSLYMHFFIEHNRGHHKNVSTPEDPSSGRYGEPLYVFWFRSVIGTWLSAWHLEAVRLKANKLKTLSLYNEMLRFQVIQTAFVFGIFWFFGGTATLFFVCAAVFGFLLLETVNYIEHYGLTRKRKGNHYERTLPIHSWNSNHPIGRLLLFELSRHSDHHYLASRKYQILRNFDESPQMPTGYPGMMLLSLVPPLWFWVMHERIKNLEIPIRNNE